MAVATDNALNESGERRRGESLYQRLRADLEAKHFGRYVMINTETGDYVTGETLSVAHTEFLNRYGLDAPGWGTRIGVSAFAGG